MNTWSGYKNKMVEKELNYLYIILGYTNKSVKRNKIKKQIKYFKGLKKK